MNTVIIENIKIIYSKKQDIQEIIKIIELNNYLFLDFKNKTLDLTNTLNSNNRNIISVSNFNDFFNNLLKNFLEKQDIQEVLKSNKLLPSLYLQLLAKKSDNSFLVSVQLNNISDNILWLLIACKYYSIDEQFDKISNFLKYRTNEEDIIIWLKETQRFTSYNYLLEITLIFLKQYDLSFCNHLKDIITAYSKKITTYLTTTKENYKLDKMTLEEVNSTFLDFLRVINAPKEWQNIYQNLLKNNKIIYVYNKENINISCARKKVDGDIIITVLNDGTINTFISLVHEFMHYFTLKDSNIPFSLHEFPSIYFEHIAAKYLISIGYNRNIVENTIQFRSENNFSIYQSLLDIMLDINDYQENGPLTIEQKIEDRKKGDEMLINVLRNAGINNDLLESLISRASDIKQYEKEINAQYDSKILKFMKHGLLILNGYQYLIDSYLADILLEKDIGNKIFYVVENLENFTIDSILKYLGVNDLLHLSDTNDYSLKI